MLLKFIALIIYFIKNIKYFIESIIFFEHRLFCVYYRLLSVDVDKYWRLVFLTLINLVVLPLFFICSNTS